MSTNNCSNPCYPNQFFQNIEGNLTKIVWAHAVNSRAKLEEALLSSKSIVDKRNADFSSFLVYCIREMSRQTTLLWLPSRVQIPASIVKNDGIVLEIFDMVSVNIPFGFLSLDRKKLNKNCLFDTCHKLATFEFHI